MTTLLFLTVIFFINIIITSAYISPLRMVNKWAPNLLLQATAKDKVSNTLIAK